MDHPRRRFVRLLALVLGLALLMVVAVRIWTLVRELSERRLRAKVAIAKANRRRMGIVGDTYFVDYSKDPPVAVLSRPASTSPTSASSVTNPASNAVTNH